MDDSFERVLTIQKKNITTSLTVFVSLFAAGSILLLSKHAVGGFFLLLSLGAGALLYIKSRRMNSELAKASVPLVLHGGSGISDEDFRKAISLGIAKINIGTASFNNVTKFAADYLSTEGKHTYFALNDAMTQGMYENAVRHIKVFRNL